MNADPSVMEFMPDALTRGQSNELADRIDAHFLRYGFGLCAVELRSSAGFVGFIGLAIPPFEAFFTPCVEIGWRLSFDCWGKGLATEGARSMIRYASDELKLESLVSYTAFVNIRSRRVMEKLGMTYDPSDDFDYPRLAEGHPLRKHVLYRLRL
jgi:RimJ/RimL family protein N-acetyltransferase